jgi:hypothetical protein
MAFSIQIAVLIAILGYLVQCCAYMHRRSLQDWEHLHGDFAAEPMSNALNRPAQNFPDAWMRFRSARVALEMTDYAERNCSSGSISIERVQLASLRRDAMQVRIASLVDMAKCVLPR